MNIAQKIRENRAVAVLLSFFGLLVALWFLLSGVLGLITNEQDALHRTKTLAEGKRLVISIEPDQSYTHYENNLVHLSGELTTDETIIDPMFQMNVYALKLRRVVEMYQWQENQSQDEADNLEYTYQKVWLESFIDSHKFKEPNRYHNPAMPLKSQLFIAKQVKLSHFILPSQLLEKMNHYQWLPMTDLSFWKAEDNLQSLLQDKPSHLKKGIYYVGQNLDFPKIGDLQIKFEIVQPETISVIAKQVNSNLVPYQTQTGGNIELFEYGTVSANKMFINARISLFFNKLYERFIDFFMIFLGIYIIFNVLWIAKTSFPFMNKPSNIVGWLLSLIISAVLTLIIIGMTWKNYSPVIGITLLVIAVFSLYFLKFARKSPKLSLIPETVVPQKMIND